MSSIDDDSAGPYVPETVNDNLPKKQLDLDISAVIPSLNHPLHYSLTSFKFMLDAGPHTSPLFNTNEHSLIHYNWFTPNVKKAADITVHETFTAFAEDLMSERDHNTAFTTFMT